MLIAEIAFALKYLLHEKVWYEYQRFWTAILCLGPHLKFDSLLSFVVQNKTIYCLFYNYCILG